MRTAIAMSVLLAVSVAHADTQNPETLTERSHETARAVLDRAVAALGGENELRAIRAVRVVMETEGSYRLQAPTPEPPFPSSRLDETVTMDLEGGRLLAELRGEYGVGAPVHNTTRIVDGEGTIFNHRARTYRPFPSSPSIERELAVHGRRTPHLILRAALDQAGTLRSLGSEQFDGKLHDVLTFVTVDAQQLTVYVERERALVSKYELPVIDPLAGEDVAEVIFDDYRRSGRTQLPRSVRAREAGQETTRSKLAITLNPRLDDRSFEVPAAGFERVGPSRLNRPEQVERLADGVFVIHNVAGPTQNSMAVELEDFIVAIEAPGSSAGTERVIERIKATIPGKPIRYVVMTHHHGDHMGGLRSFIAEGATVVTAPGNRRIVEQLAAAPHRDRLAAQPKPLEVVVIENGRHTLTDGKRTLELIDIGPNPHSREMVIAYLPKERIVFQADVFAIASNEAPLGPPNGAAVSFARRLEELRLEVSHIASVHGRTATFDEFRSRVSEYREPGAR